LAVFVGGKWGEGWCWNVGIGSGGGGGDFGGGGSYSGGQGRLGFGVILTRTKYLGYFYNILKIWEIWPFSIPLYLESF